MNTPIERFYPQLWDSRHALVNENPILPPELLESLPFYYEPYEDSINIGGSRNFINRGSKDF